MKPLQNDAQWTIVRSVVSGNEENHLRCRNRFDYARRNSTLFGSGQVQRSVQDTRTWRRDARFAALARREAETRRRNSNG